MIIVIVIVNKHKLRRILVIYLDHFKDLYTETFIPFIIYMYMYAFSICV